MKNSKYIVFVFALFFSLSLQAKSYNSILKKNTKHKTVFVWDNMEARLNWYGTYFSPEFKEQLSDKISSMGLSQDLSQKHWWVEHEMEDKDVFFVSVYEGSAKWSEIGKDDALWKFESVGPHGDVIAAQRIENIPITQTERALFPYLDKWSKAYLVIFPKNSLASKPQLKLLSPSAQSILKW